jgi:hypothetical protein
MSVLLGFQFLVRNIYFQQKIFEILKNIIFPLTVGTGARQMCRPECRRRRDDGPQDGAFLLDGPGEITFSVSGGFFKGVLKA